jgi:hypothetical protein
LAFSWLVFACLASPARSAEPCKTTSVSIDTSLANNSGGTLINSVGQTFFTTDTLMTSLTVWGVPGGITYNPVSAVLVATDPAGVPTSTRLWVGPAMTLPGSAGPKAFTWTMDPPLLLPHAGTYAWFVCSTIVDLLTVDGVDVYTDGTAWDTCRGDCGPSLGCEFRVDADFAFTVTFCGDRPTPARRHTWGELKTIYR